MLCNNQFVAGQEKKWTLEECVKYAVDNNITIKQTIDPKISTLIKKRCF
jgi:outer membrane protein